MRRLLLFFFFLCSIPLFSQAKHPFTFEDMMKLKRVEEPEVSPDGKWVLFAAVDVDLAANTKTPHIWIVPTAGGQEKEIIADQDADRPRWAPDGKRFAFVSSKKGGPQVWIANFDAAAASVTRTYKLTSMPTGAGGELWSPDDQTILFTSDVYPECDHRLDEIDCNANTVDEAQKSQVKALVFDRLLYRHWNAYKAGKRTHIFVMSVSEPPSGVLGVLYPGVSRPHDLTPGDYDSPVFSLGGQDNYAFSPDGLEVCYSSHHDKDEAASTNNDLWIVSADFRPRAIGGGQSTVRVPSYPAKNITADNPASDSTPLYSPDGKYIAYRAQARPGYESDRFRLMLYDRKTGERKNLTEGYDKWVGSYIWAPDSSHLYFVAEDKGTSPVHSVSFGSEVIEDKGYDITIHQTNIKIDAFLPGFNDDLAITQDGQTLLYTQMSAQFPSIILSYRLETRETGKVDLHPYNDGCHPNEHGTMDAKYCSVVEELFGEIVANPNGSILSHVSKSPLESFWFTGAHDEKVQGFLVKPPNFDASKKYPVKFLIHGGPEGAWGDDWSFRWNPELFAASGYVVIMINFHGSTGYGQKFIDAINGDWGGAPFEDLMKGLDYAEKTYPFIDKDRECALGASYGGYMANWILGHTDRFKCIVSHDGMFNAESAWGDTEELWFNDWEFRGTPYDNREMYRKWSPHEYAKNFKTPTLVIHGQLDYRLDVSQGFDLFTTLQRENVPSKMLYFPDEGHWVLKPQNSQLWYKTVNAWVDQWVGK